MAHREKTSSTVIRREEREDDSYKYIYELTVSEGQSVSSFRIPLYSIGVEMTDRLGQIRKGTVKEAFADPGRAILFFDKVVRCLATPIDLAYIVEDEM
ncbi:MAG: hypothetical protein IJY69_05730 [Clostridia bacterium]|nr:hypothetical protein [Clostridia bacterium]